jgi:hypothetical protein
MIKDISSSLPSAEDLIRSLGLQSRQAHHDVIPSVALFGAGILVGAGLALLFAPTTGRELRDEISTKASDLAERVSSPVEEAAGENGKPLA